MPVVQMKKHCICSVSYTHLGCSPLGLDAQTLMKPPKATGERQEIYSVLEEKANHQLTLRYPCLLYTSRCV